MSAIDRARTTPIATLNSLSLRPLWRTRWTLAPNASHKKQLGTAARQEEPSEGGRLHDGASRLCAEKRSCGAHTHKPGFRVAGTRRDRGHDGEEKKRDDLLRSRNLPPPNREASSDISRGYKRMRSHEATSGGQGLERSRKRPAASWIASTRPVHGVELFRARFAGAADQKHRHDTYAIGLTDLGVQVFHDRGSVRVSTPGQVVVLHPDEVHDGRAGTDAGFGYRIVYVEPSHLAEALRVLRGRPCPLPFVGEPVSTSARLSHAVERAFRAPLESLAVDSLIVDLAEGLSEREHRGGSPTATRRVDVTVIERARQFLDAERTRIVHSTELGVDHGPDAI